MKKAHISFTNQSYVFYLFGAMLLGVKQGIYKEEEYGYLFADIMRKQSDTAL